MRACQACEGLGDIAICECDGDPCDCDGIFVPCSECNGEGYVAKPPDPDEEST